MDGYCLENDPPTIAGGTDKAGKADPDLAHVTLLFAYSNSDNVRAATEPCDCFPGKESAQSIAEGRSLQNFPTFALLV